VGLPCSRCSAPAPHPHRRWAWSQSRPRSRVGFGVLAGPEWQVTSRAVLASSFSSTSWPMLEEGGLSAAGRPQARGSPVTLFVKADHPPARAWQSAREAGPGGRHRGRVPGRAWPRSAPGRRGGVLGRHGAAVSPRACGLERWHARATAGAALRGPARRHHGLVVFHLPTARPPTPSPPVTPSPPPPTPAAQHPAPRPTPTPAPAAAAQAADH